jgi:hypothetical protein
MTKQILDAGMYDQLLLTSPARLTIRGQSIQIQTDSESKTVATLDVRGGVGASCAFYKVRASSIQLGGESLLTMEVPDSIEGSGISIKSHKAFEGTMTSSHGSNGASGFVCTRVIVDGSLRQRLNGTFSPGGGDTAYFATAADARIDLRTTTSPISGTQLPVLSDFRISHIDTDTEDEQSVLLAPPENLKNEITFEAVNKVIPLTLGDLLMIQPAESLYLREFHVERGLQVSFHGKVSDIKVGAGPGDLRSTMPSLLEQLDHQKLVLLAIPALAGLIIGALEKMGVLSK